MPWIKVDDHYSEHPKIVSVGPLGQALWFAGLAYCNRNLTDGFIPWSTANSLVSWDFLDEGKPTRIYVGSQTMVHEENAVTSEYVALLLLEARLWDEVPGGYQVHDYTDYQPRKAEVVAERAAWADRQKRARESRGESRPESRRESRGDSPMSRSMSRRDSPSPVPVPVPVPESTPKGALSLAPARTREDEPESPVVTWMANHGAALDANNGLYRHVVMLVERHGAPKVIATMARLGEVATPRQYVLGAENALEAIPAPERPKRADPEADEIERRRARERAAQEKERQRRAELAALDGRTE